METTKRLSLAECAPHTMASWRIDGCDYDAVFAKERWRVVAVQYQIVAGEHVHASSGNMYVFNVWGELIEVVPGM